MAKRVKPNSLPPRAIREVNARNSRVDPRADPSDIIPSAVSGPAPGARSGTRSAQVPRDRVAVPSTRPTPAPPSQYPELEKLRRDLHEEEIRDIDRDLRVASLEELLAKKDRWIAELEEALRFERTQREELEETVVRLRRLLADV